MTMAILRPLLVALLTAVAVSPSIAVRTQLLQATGVQPEVVDKVGGRTSLYEESHALLISASEYIGAAKGGWQRLPSTTGELDELAEALRKHGFSVVRVYDPTSEELNRALSRFLAEHGQKRKARLLVVFSGHGHTNPENDFGYLVPVDAKDPLVDPSDFLAKAYPILNLDVAARGIVSKHALFVFDSCFSGTIFSLRGAKSVLGPPTSADRLQYLLGRSQSPMRQFIAAGGAGEKLPARSSFVPLLLHALRYGTPSRLDGYMTGKELGQWLEQTLPSLTGGSQNPQSGAIRDAALAMGDMVFQIPGSGYSSEGPMFASTPSADRGAEGGNMADGSASTRSIAVLPFKLTSTSPNDREFAGLLSKQVTAVLGAAAGIQVASAGRAELLVGRSTSRGAAEDLRVGYIVEGSVYSASKGEGWVSVALADRGGRNIYTAEYCIPAGENEAAATLLAVSIADEVSRKVLGFTASAEPGIVTARKRPPGGDCNPGKSEDGMVRMSIPNSTIFDRESIAINQSFYPTIRSVVESVQRSAREMNVQVGMIVESYSESYNDREKEARISTARSLAMRAMLVAAGFSDARIVSIGKGYREQAPGGNSTGTTDIFVYTGPPRR